MDSINSMVESIEGGLGESVKINDKDIKIKKHGSFQIDVFYKGQPVGRFDDADRDAGLEGDKLNLERARGFIEDMIKAGTLDEAVTIAEGYDIPKLIGVLDQLMPTLKRFGFKSKKKVGATFDLKKPLEGGDVFIATFSAPQTGYAPDEYPSLFTLRSQVTGSAIDQQSRDARRANRDALFAELMTALKDDLEFIDPSSDRVRFKMKK